MCWLVASFSGAFFAEGFLGRYREIVNTKHYKSSPDTADFDQLTFTSSDTIADAYSDQVEFDTFGEPATTASLAGISNADFVEVSINVPREKLNTPGYATTISYDLDRKCSDSFSFSDFNGEGGGVA